MTYETLEELVALSGGTLHFPELNNYNSKKSVRKNKNKSSKGFFKSLFSNPLTPKSGDDGF